MPDENPNWIADEDDRVRAYKEILLTGNHREIIKLMKALYRHREKQDMRDILLFQVCQAWHSSYGCKSRHGYLPPSVANHKPKTAMSRGRKWCSKVDEPTNRNQI